MIPEKPIVFVVCGLPGSGKTHFRKQIFTDYPCVDIADIYRYHNGRFADVMGALDWETATRTLLRRVRKLLRQNYSVVVEGVFLPGTPSRKIIEEDAQVGGYSLEFIELTAPPEVCHQRIMAQYKQHEIGWPEANERLKILKSITQKREGKS